MVSVGFSSCLVWLALLLRRAVRQKTPQWQQHVTKTSSLHSSQEAKETTGPKDKTD